MVLIFAKLEVKDPNLPEVIEGHTTMRVLELIDVWLQITGNGLVDVQFGYQKSPNAGIVWSGQKQTLDLSLNEIHAPQRVNGRYLAYRIGSWEEGNELSGNWQLSGIEMQVIEDGER